MHHYFAISKTQKMMHHACVTVRYLVLYYIVIIIYTQIIAPSSSSRKASRSPCFCLGVQWVEQSFAFSWPESGIVSSRSKSATPMTYCKWQWYWYKPWRYERKYDRLIQRYSIMNTPSNDLIRCFWNDEDGYTFQIQEYQFSTFVCCRSWCRTQSALMRQNPKLDWSISILVRRVRHSSHAKWHQWDQWSVSSTLVGRISLIQH